MKLLVVDDSATMRRIVVTPLKRIGFPECAEAEDGITGLEAFDSSVDFVVKPVTPQVLNEKIDQILTAVGAAS